MKLAIALFSAVLAVPAMADPGVSDAAKSEMAKLSRMAGKWSGSGWMDIPRAGRHTFDSEETVEPKLGGAALLIEGLHRDAQSRAVVHHALGLLSYDLQAKGYRMSTALANGRGGSFAASVDGHRFIWTIESPGVPTRRFTISFEDANRWVEIGEYSLDGGAQWTRFFEMELKRVK